MNKQYIQNLYSQKPIDVKADAMRKFADINGIPILNVHCEKLLQTIVAAKNPSKILEIGTAIGYSGILMLKSCDGMLNTIEMDENNISIARKNFYDFGFAGRATIFAGDAREIMPKLSGKYDFVFMDGPKAQYIEFLPYIINLLNVGGILMCDNVLFRGLVAQGEDPSGRFGTIVKKLNYFLKEITTNDKLTSCVLDVGDGVSISVKTSL